MTNSAVYQHPKYYALGYRWNTGTECDFIEAALAAHRVTGKALLDIGCGTGRHALELVKRGYAVTGVDPSPEMRAFLEAEAARAKRPVRAVEGDLRRLNVTGPFTAAYCFMDTFRFLLTNDDVVAHLRAVAALLAPGGVYLTDFWVPRQWDLIGNEIHQWEQAQGDTTVRVFYLQHPDSIDPIAQTFEDELVFEVHEGGQVEEIRGGRTRTRLLLPQEFRALVAVSGAFDVAGAYGEFDLAKPFDAASLSWRMISVLTKR